MTDERRGPDAVHVGRVDDFPLGRGRRVNLPRETVAVFRLSDGWFALHERFGKLPIADVLAPAIQYARDGAPVAEIIAGYWANDAESFKGYPGFADLFMPGGRAPLAG